MKPAETLPEKRVRWQSLVTEQMTITSRKSFLPECRNTENRSDLGYREM